MRSPLITVRRIVPGNKRLGLTWTSAIVDLQKIMSTTRFRAARLTYPHKRRALVMNLIPSIILLTIVTCSFSIAGLNRDASGRISLSRENTPQEESSTPLPAPAPEPKESTPIPSPTPAPAGAPTTTTSSTPAPKKKAAASKKHVKKSSGREKKKSTAKKKHAKKKK
ncbi:MAG: hypothetical protein WCJ23_02925 [Verrucomicrobiota bacterium]